MKKNISMKKSRIIDLPGLKAHSIIQESLFKQMLFVKIEEGIKIYFSESRVPKNLEVRAERVRKKELINEGSLQDLGHS